MDLQHNTFSGKVRLHNLPLALQRLILNDNQFEGNVDLHSLPPDLWALDTVSVPCWYFFLSSSFLSPATGILLLYFHARCRPALRPKLSLSIVEAGDALPPLHPFPTHSPGVSVLPSLSFPFSRSYLSEEAMRHGGLP